VMGFWEGPLIPRFWPHCLATASFGSLCINAVHGVLCHGKQVQGQPTNRRTKQRDDESSGLRKTETGNPALSSGT
jgi:hypothetical protein